MFTTLWTIWNHRNQVVHEGKCPNPIEIMLTSQNLLCRYQNAFNCDQVPGIGPCYNNFEELDFREWQLLIGSKRDKKTRRSGYAFEAINKEGNKIFMKCNSIGDGTHVMAAKEALLVPLMQAKKLGFHHIIALAEVNI